MSTFKLPPRCRDHAERVKGCPVCNARNAAYQRERNRLIAAGQWQGYQPAEPVREHLAAICNGYGSVIAAERVSGVDEATIRELLSGRKLYLLAVNAEALLALTADDIARARTLSLVPACGTQRRIWGAMWQGWPQVEIARHLNRHRRTLEEWLVAEMVTVETHELVRLRVGHDLARRPGPSTRAAALARRAGRLPVWAWSEIDRVGARHSDAAGEQLSGVA